MKSAGKAIKKNAAMIVFLLAMIVCIGILCYHHMKEEAYQDDITDHENLRKVIAEAYININEDPDFVNTATEDQPMEVPEKYYTYVESVQGDGRVHVIVRVDGRVNAYFGTPEKTIGYYMSVTGLDTD